MSSTPSPRRVHRWSRLVLSAVFGALTLTALTVVPAYADAAPGAPGVTEFVRGDGSFTVTPVPASNGGPVTSYLVEALLLDGQGQPVVGPAAGSCTVPAAGPVSGSGAVQGSCVIGGLVRTSVYMVRTTATGPGGTTVGPTGSPVVPVTNASVAELFRCDGAPGQPRSIPVSIASINQEPETRREDGRTVVRMTPALPAGAGTLVLTPAISYTAAEVVRFSRNASFITDLMDPTGVGFVPNAAGDPVTGTTTTVYSEASAYPSQLVQLSPNTSERNRYVAAALFLPAPGSPYCADLKTQAYFVSSLSAGEFADWSWFLDDPRIVPDAPVVQPGPFDASTGTGSATVTVTAPAAARFVTSYTVTASPGGATCTIPSPTADQTPADSEAPVSPLACTITGLTPLADGKAYTFTAASNGPWGRLSVVGIDLNDAKSLGSVPATSVPSPPATPAAPTPLTVSADTLSKTYGEVDPDLTYTVTGLQEGDSLTTPPTCSRVPGENAGVKAITCTGAAADQTYALTRTPKYSTITHVAGDFTITKRPVTVTPTGQSITYGDALPTSFPYTITGGSLVGGDTLTGSCGVAGAPKAAGQYKITCELSAGPNYEVTVAEAYLTIAKKDGVITPDPQAITFGDPDPTFTYSVSGLEEGDTLDTAPTCGVAGAHSNAGEYTITCAGGADENYTLTQSVTATLTVNKAPVVVTANNATKVYGAADPVFGATVTGVDELDVAPTCGVNSEYGDAAEYTITCTGASAGPNYQVTYVDGTFTITKAPLTLTAENKSRVAGAENPTFTYTVGGLVNSDTAGTAFTGTPALSTTATTNSAPGTYPISITAGTVSSSNYAASYVPGTLTVTAVAPPGKVTPTLSPGALVIKTKNKGKTVTSITVSAKLTDNGAAVKGKKVTFSVPGITLCTATTNASGVATCSIGVIRAAAILFHGGYTATFAGDATYNKISVFSRDVRVVKS